MQAVRISGSEAVPTVLFSLLHHLFIQAITPMFDLRIEFRQSVCKPDFSV
jgi:hypothetical protein